MVCWRLLGCWRMVWPAVVDGWRLMLQAGGCWPFWVPERQGGRETPPGGGGAVGGVQCGGARVCRGWPSGWPAWWLLVVCRGWLGGGDPAAICGGNSAVFNQQLTTFLAVAMVWRLPVFFLCSYWQFRRRCLADDDRRPAPRLRCGVSWPRMQQAVGQAGRY